MASPQAEAGYTRIANELIEAFSRQQLSGHEWRVLMALLRETYGWSRKTATIGIGKWVAITGLQAKRVWPAITSLAARNIITVTRGSYRNIYQVQKDYEQWTAPTNIVQKSGLSTNQDSPEKRTKNSPENRTKHSPEIGTTSKKERNKEKREAQAPRAPKEKPDHPPAVEVYWHITKRYPVKEWWDKIDSIVGRELPDLQFWSDVIFNYRGTFPNGYHVKAMLEYYQRREIPGQRPGNGHQPGTGPPAAPDWQRTLRDDMAAGRVRIKEDFGT